jgi:hypothetical protein
MTRQIENGSDSMNNKLKLDLFVTGSHIFMIFGYTTSTVFALIVPYVKALDFSNVQGFQA